MTPTYVRPCMMPYEPKLSTDVLNCACLLLQTLLQTEILKNQLQIASNLKSNTATATTASHHSQLLGSTKQSPSNSTSVTSTSSLGECCYPMPVCWRIVTLLWCYTVGTSSPHQFNFDGMYGITSTPQLSPAPTLSSVLTSISQEKVGSLLEGFWVA